MKACYLTRQPCKKVISKYLKVWLVSFFVLLTGCAGQVNMLPTLSEQSTPLPGEGLVVVRVINASSMGLPFNHFTITPENLNESKQIKPDRLTSLAPQRNGTTVFASSAKPGSYALSSIRAFYSRGDIWYSKFVSSDAQFGTFSVESGKVTDLGTIIYYQKSQEDRYTHTLIRLPDSEPAEVLKKHFPFYQYDPNNLLSWNEDGSDEDHENLFTSAAQNPVTYNESYKAPDGSLYFIGKLGVIIKRSKEGEWSLDAVDTNFDLFAISQNNRGDLAIGGAEGTVFFKAKGGEWQSLPLNHHYQVNTLTFDDSNNLQAIARADTELTVFKTSPLQRDPTWSTLNRFSTRDGWENSLIPPPPEKTQKKAKKKVPKLDRILNFSLSESKSGPLITVGTQSQREEFIFASTKEHIFRYDAQSWQILGVGAESEMSSVVDAGTIKLGIKQPGFWSWDGKPDFFRYVKESDQWEEIATHVLRCPDGTFTIEKECVVKKVTKRTRRAAFNFISRPWFKNDKEAVAIVNFSKFNAWTGKRTNNVKIVSTEDGGKSWQVTENKLPKDYCTRLIPELDDRLLVSCVGAVGDFYESLDYGKSWSHVREHENL